MNDPKDFVIDNGVLVRYSGNEESVTIPDGVTDVGSRAFTGCAALVEVIVPESVQVIEESAFRGCRKLKSIILPARLVRIGDRAFKGCRSLEHINIPDSVISVGDEAFCECEGMHEISVNGSIERIGRTAFQSNYNIDFWITVRGIPSERLLKSGGTLYFADLECGKIPLANNRRDVNVRIAAKRLAQGEELPQSIYRSYVKYIKAHKEKWLNYYSRYNIPILHWMMQESLIGIQEIDPLIELVSQEDNPELLNQLMAYQAEHFGQEDYDRHNEKEFRKMEKDVQQAEEIQPLRGDVNDQKYIDKTWTVSKKNPYVTSYKDNVDEVHFPTQVGKTVVSGIADKFAFKGEGDDSKDEVHRVVIPEGYTYIGENAFQYCAKLKEVILPSTVETIANNAFEGCRSLKKVVVPDRDRWVKLILGGWPVANAMKKGRLVFNDAIVRELVIPDGVTCIPASAFQKCGGLVSVVIPESVTTIGESAFAECPDLESVTIQGDVQRIQRNTFIDCVSLKNVKLPGGLQHIDAHAFRGCKGLTSLILPRYLETVEKEAFAYSGIKALVFQSYNVKLKDMTCLRGCKDYTIYSSNRSLARHYIPEKWMPIDAYAPDDPNNPFSQLPHIEAGRFSGMTFVLDCFGLDDMKPQIEAAGGRVTGTVSSRTDYLVVNNPEGDSSTVQKARQLGVKIIGVRAFLKMAGLM